MPIYLQLRDFGAWLKDNQGTEPSVLCQWAGERLARFELADPSARAGCGRLLWLLDGLDEIFDQGIRDRAARIIGAYCRDAHFGADRVIVTTRPHALDQSGIREELGLAEHTAQILALDAADQRVFLRGWFGALYPDDGTTGTSLHDDLWQKLERKPNLRQLRGTPLLLSMIATINHLGKSLPERRADLYEKAVWNLLQRRYGPKARGGADDRLVREMRRALMGVARWMMKQGAVRQIGAPDFIRLLASHDPSPDWRQWADTEAVAEDLGAHSGLLVKKDNAFSFIHLGFQEFLAAREIAHTENPAMELAPHLREGKWRDVVSLTVGYLYECATPRQGEAILKGLLGKGEETDCADLALALEAASQAPPGELGALEAELVNRALAIIADVDSRALEQDRFAVGIALSKLGDPRLGLEKAENWAPLEAFDGATTHLSRFPITNHDYRAFIAAGGYQERRYWEEADWEWLIDAMPDPNARFPATWWNPKWNAPNQPIIGVSWYEASAFCRWLTEHFDQRESPFPERSLLVGLPDMATWDRVSGSGRRQYPWGNEIPDQTRANSGGRLGRTSPVGLYPKGAVTGLLDLGGNVWEWTADVDNGGYPFLRGGSWGDPNQDLAFSSHDWVRPGFRSLDFGFRCRLGPRASDE